MPVKKTTKTATKQAAPTIKKRVYLLLDRSGSMDGAWEATLGGINRFIEKVGDADVTVASFDSESYDVLRRCSSMDWSPLRKSEVSPRGGTPLLDAAGRMIWTIQDDKPDRAVLVIVTDGEENQSVKFKKHEIQAYVTDIQRSENLDVVFLGANFDGVAEVAAYTGMNDRTRSMSYSSIVGAHNAYSATSAATSSFLSGGAKSMNFYSEEDRTAAKSPVQSTTGSTGK